MLTEVRAKLGLCLRTQAIYYRDERGVEPVDDFIEALPPKRAAKIDDYVAGT